MRVVLCLLTIALLTTLSHSAEPDLGGGPISMMLVKIDGDKLLSQSTSTITKNVIVAGVDGTTKTMMVKEEITTTTTRELKLIRATGNDNKEIVAADLTRLLKDTSPVIFLQKPISADLKAKFKSNAIFLEYAETMPVEKK